MAHLITGYAGSEHIKSADQGAFNAAFFGEGQFVMEIGSKYSASITDNSTVRVLDGDLLMYGRHIRIEPNTYEDMTIVTGTAGYKRIDLVVMTYEKDMTTGIESAYLEVIKGTQSTGTPTAPSYIQGNILTGATKNQMPLYKVSIEGVVLTSVTKLFNTCPTYAALAARYEEEFRTACEEFIESLDVDTTLSETSSNPIANSAVTRELKNKATMVLTTTAPEVGSASSYANGTIIAVYE